MFVDVSGICSAVGKVNVPCLKAQPLLENGFQIVFCLLHPFFRRLCAYVHFLWLHVAMTSV